MKRFVGFMILILLIIVIIIVSMILSYKKKEVAGNAEVEGKSSEINVAQGDVIKYPENRADCFTAIRLVEEYMNYIASEDAQKLINITASEYINEDNVLVNNIVAKVKDDFMQYSNNYEIILNDIYISEANPTFQTYFINLLYYNKDNNQRYATKIMVQLDNANSTYQIMPYKYMQKKGYDKLALNDMFEAKSLEIANKNDNVYKMVPISKDSMAERYFNLYSTYLECDKEQSYNLLDKEYREKRFGTVQEYIKYVTENELENAIISKYQIISYDNYTQYVCVDSNGRYYIFNENSVMNFSLILDTYTIDIPAFTEKYNSSNENQKVALNIDKFMTAINAKDYKYAYNCLADSYKNNYFKTEAEFENYARANFYDNNTVTYDNFETQGDLYICKVTISDTKTENKKQKTFIMQLGQGTKFVMSFDV